MYLSEINYAWSMSQTHIDTYLDGWTITGGNTSFSNEQTNVTKTNCLITNWSRNGSNTFYTLGNVGIGTNVPGTLLEIKKDTASGGYGGYPAITLNNDNNNGFSVLHFNQGSTQKARVEVSNSSGTMGLYTTSGTNGILINSSGNVGIGTTSPSTKLTLEDSATNAAVQIGFRNDAREWRTGVHGGINDSFTLFDVTANSTRLVVNSSGNVGIGTTSPTANLHVQNASTATLKVITTGIADASVNIQGYDAGVHIGDATNGLRWAIWNDGPSTSSSLKFGSYALGTWYNNSSQVVTMTSDGKVGIRTTSPSARLSLGDASGQQFYVYEGGNVRSGLGVDLSGSSRELSMFCSSSTGFTNGNISFGYRLESNGAYQERMRMTSAGNLGINITNPGQKLTVQGDGSGTSDVVRIIYGNGSHSGNGLNIRAANSGKVLYAEGSVGAGFAEITTAYNANPNFRISGDVVAYATSDKRFKDNLETIENPINKINKLNGYTFDWNNKQDVYKGKDYGVVAQEVEKIMPELVDTRFDGYKAVKYEKLIPLLIESIKELEARVKELEKKP